MLEREGLSSYSRDGKLQGVELDGKKYRFKRTIGVDLDQHQWAPAKTPDKEIDTPKMETSAEVPQVETSPIPELEAVPLEPLQSPSKEDSIQMQHESTSAQENDSPKACAEDLPKVSPIEGPIHPHHIQRSSELNSLRVHRKIGRDRDEKDDNDGFRR